MSVQGIVLAAGLGRRMSPLTGASHKGLLRVGDRTLLERIVDGLEDVGAEAVTVVTGHAADDVRAHLASRPRCRFVHNPRYAQTNNVVSLALGLAALPPGEEDVVLVECDLLLGDGVLQRLAGPDRGNIALLDPYRVGMDGTVVTLRDGVIDAIHPPDTQTDAFDYRGTYKTLNVYRFTRAFCREVLGPLFARGADVEHAYYEAVLAQLDDLAVHRIAGLTVDGDSWAELDDPQDVAAARFVFEPASRPALHDRAQGGAWAWPGTDFAFMRNVHFPPPALRAALAHALPRLLTSYGSAQPVLDEKLAWVLGCDPAHLVALNGAAQVYPLLRHEWAGLRVGVPSPTFGEYARAAPGAVTYADDGTVDLERLEALAADVDVLVVVSPNNPTGTTLPTAWLHGLAGRHPGTAFLVDESFVDFSDERPLRERLEADPLPNVTVLCSLSKTLGVPGLRIGYVHATDPARAAGIRAELPIWNMNAVAEHFVELLLKYRPELQAALEQTKCDREVQRTRLAAVAGVAEVHPSGGDFLLVRLDGPADRGRAVRAALLADDATDVKVVTGRFTDGAPRLRIGIRTDAENAGLAAALGRVLQVT